MMTTKPAETLAMSSEEIKVIEARHAEMIEELEGSGEIVNGAGLHLPDETTTLRLAEGSVSSSTGPVIAGQEPVTGYYVVDVASQARAEEIAARILDHHVTAVEVRQIHNTSGM